MAEMIFWGRGVLVGLGFNDLPQYSLSVGPSIFLSRADLCREVVRGETCQNAPLPWEPRPREERAASANCHSSLTSAANPAARNHPMELQPHPAQVRAACKPRERGGAGLSFSPASPCCHGLPGDKSPNSWLQHPCNPCRPAHARVPAHLG